jgi:mono/diheme cytochrome c family protein
MKVKTFFAILLTTSSVSNMVCAGDVNWSESTITPFNESTVRAYGLKYSPTPDTSYNVDFTFNETTLSFESDLSTLTTVDISKYAEADIVRGGLLYDKWWKINEESEPTDTYVGYPEVGSQTGSITWRCQECHGWDYKGNEGAYESGSSHYSGISGLYDIRNKTEAEIYGNLVAKNLPLSEQDIWDLTKFLKEGLIDMNKYIIFSGIQQKSATGDTENGRVLYEGTAGCIKCHGDDGNKIETVSVAAIANDNPWEVLHKVRFGNPGTKMPSAVKKGLSLQEQIDILTYVQTLPQIDIEHTHSH